MIVLASMPRFLWTEVVNTTTFLINRFPITTNLQVTPYQHLFRKILHIAFLRAFGYKMHVWIDKNQRGKLEAKVKINLFVEYE